MAKSSTNICAEPSVHLTPATDKAPAAINVVISQLISYSQEMGFTRLRLTGHKTLDVKETTERIDHLVRRAATAA